MGPTKKIHLCKYVLECALVDYFPMQYYNCEMWSITYLKPINNLDKVNSFPKKLLLSLNFLVELMKQKLVGRYPGDQEIVFSQTK